MQTISKKVIEHAINSLEITQFLKETFVEWKRDEFPISPMKDSLTACLHPDSDHSHLKLGEFYKKKIPQVMDPSRQQFVASLGTTTEIKLTETVDPSQGSTFFRRIKWRMPIFANYYINSNEHEETWYFEIDNQMISVVVT
jgi:hypothetical protein